jgi:peptidyl-prolyl cis-trans isomerase A (cyclophilin A)
LTRGGWLLLEHGSTRSRRSLGCWSSGFRRHRSHPDFPANPASRWAPFTPTFRNHMIRFETTLGDFTIELFEKEAPVAVANFLKYIDDGFFDGTIFHRIVPGFVIQGGGFTEDMTQKKTHPPIKNEADNGLKNERGTLSMARTNDINSATSQFFVNLKDNDFLDHTRGNFGYAVFARVTEGMDVIDKIAAVEDRPRAASTTCRRGGHHESVRHSAG